MKLSLKKFAVLPAAALLALTLAACGGDDSSDNSSGDDNNSESSQDESASPSESESSDDEPTETDESDDDSSANGVEPGKPGFQDGVFTGNGYAFQAPDGWEDNTKLGKNISPLVDAAVSRGGDTDGFADNITVTRQDPAPFSDLDDIESQLQTQYGSAGLESVDDAELAGEDANAITANPDAPGGSGKYELVRYDVLKDDVHYGVELSFSPSVGEAERQKTIDSILDSWTWTS